MQPVHEIDAASCTHLLGIAFDIDDTLTAHGRVEAEAYEALWRLRAAGLRLVAATGRPLGWADVIARQWPVDAAVGENGAGWAYQRDGRMWEGYRYTEAERHAQQAQLAQVVDAIKRQWPKLRLADDQRARRCDVAFDVGEAAELDPGERQRLARAIAALGARCVVSSVHAHVVLGDWNKANGIVAAMAQACDMDVAGERERWLFVGDSGNDAEAFAFFPLSAGVANVAAHVARLPVPPRFVARAPRGQGFAEIAAAVLQHRPQRAQPR